MVFASLSLSKLSYLAWPVGFSLLEQRCRKRFLLVYELEPKFINTCLSRIEISVSVSGPSDLCEEHLHVPDVGQSPFYSHETSPARGLPAEGPSGMGTGRRGLGRGLPRNR